MFQHSGLIIKTVYGVYLLCLKSYTTCNNSFVERHIFRTTVISQIKLKSDWINFHFLIQEGHVMYSQWYTKQNPVGNQTCPYFKNSLPQSFFPAFLTHYYEQSNACQNMLLYLNCVWMHGKKEAITVPHFLWRLPCWLICLYYCGYDKRTILYLE